MGFKHPTFRMWCTRSNRLLYRRDHRKEWLYWIHIYTHICHVFLKIRNLRILRLLLFPRTSCVHHIITNFCKYRMYCYPFFFILLCTWQEFKRISGVLYWFIGTATTISYMISLEILKFSRRLSRAYSSSKFSETVFRANGVAIFDTGHHLTSRPTDIKVQDI